MKKLKFIATSILMVFSMSAFAQSKNMGKSDDVLYLKNGSVIRGTLVEFSAGKSVKIETKDGNLFSYGLDDIEKMVKEEPYAVKETQHSNFNKPKGYFGLMELTLPTYVLNPEILPVGVSIVNGYRVCPQFAIGVGVGLMCGIADPKPAYIIGEQPNYKLLYSSSGTGWYIPLYLHMRSDFLKAKVSPFIALEIGYNFLLSDDLDNEGFFVNPSVGVSYNVGKYRMTTSLEVCNVFAYYGYLDPNCNLKVGFSF